MENNSWIMCHFFYKGLTKKYKNLGLLFYQTKKNLARLLLCEVRLTVVDFLGSYSFFISKGNSRNTSCFKTNYELN